MTQDKFEELILEQLADINNRISSLEEKFEKRFDSIETRLGSLEQEGSWIRGRLEGRGEFWTDIKSWIAIAVATAAAIIAWVK